MQDKLDMVIKNKDIEILNKAWVLNTENIDEPWFCDDNIIYYGTKYRVKKCAVIDYALLKTSDGEDISFFNIKVKRNPDYDEISYNGVKIKRYKIKELIRKEKIKELPKDKMYYVQDRRNYVGNAVLWWGKNNNGYVVQLKDAHKYTYEEIIKFSPRDTDIIWESEYIEKRIREYIDMQSLDFENSI